MIKRLPLFGRLVTTRKAIVEYAVSGARVRSHAFDACHPAVPATYFACTIVLAMCAFHPVLCLLSLAGAVAYGLCARGARAVGASLVRIAPLVALVALLNPFFSSMGSTLVWTVLGRPFYLESLAYGCCMGILLSAMLLWCENAAAVITAEDTMTLAGSKAPTLALMLSMIARLIPLYVRRGRAIASVEAACTSARPTGTSALPAAARRFSVLLGWSLESSLKTADSMAARGWGACARRTSYRRYAFTGADGVMIAVVAVLAGGSALVIAHAGAYLSFYPTLSFASFDATYLVYAMLLAFP